MTHGLVLAALPCFVLSCLAPEQRRGPHLGEPHPGAIPALFAPGLVSTGLSERDGSLAPDGGCFAYTLQGSGSMAIVLIERDAEGVWAAPELAPFSSEFGDIEPSFDPSGGRLWFASRRPLAPGAEAAESEVGDWNLWWVTYARGDTALQWGEPEPLLGVCDAGPEFYPSVSQDGELVFTAEREGGQGGEDLWLARRDGDGWTVRNAGPGVNSAGPEFNACLRPDGGALVFSSVREGDQGRGDLYISERQADGTFGPARALTALNSAALDYCPTYSADGRILWFTSRRQKERDGGGGWSSLEELREALFSAGNGEDDVYWVRASALDE